MGYVIEVRQVAESTTGLAMKNGKLLKFNTIDSARDFGREEVEKSRYIASWEAISLAVAKGRGHKCK